MATNGDKVNATTTVSNGGVGEKIPKTIVDLNTTEPDIVDEGLVSESVGEKKKDEGESKVIGSDSGDVSPVDDIQKKIKRAERFGVTVKLTEEEKRNSRAERFGTVAAAVNGSEGTKKAGGETKKAEELKRKARADRFGAPASGTGTTTVDKTEEEAKKKARLARFGIDTKAATKAGTKVDTKVDSAEEDKRKARALRFSKAASDSTTDSPGKQSIGTEAVVSGNAS